MAKKFTQEDCAHVQSRGGHKDTIDFPHPEKNNLKLGVGEALGDKLFREKEKKQSTKRRNKKDLQSNLRTSIAELCISI